MKTYFLCGGRGDKKAFKETKVCGVIASKSILFLERFFLLSQKTKMYWSCWGIEKITLTQSSFPKNLNSFYAKTGNLLQRNQNSQLTVNSVV